MATTVDLIKERLGIAEVVGSYIKLEKAGVNLKARCPFHNEKTPSFMVSPSRNSFYCFGCGEKGDMFSFVEKFEGVDFLGALKILADRAGVEITYEKPGEKSEKEILFKILNDVSLFYEKNIKENKAVLEYLKERGLDKKTIEDFHVGYAPNDWRDTLEFLRKKKYSDSDIEKAGLIKKDGEGKAKDYYDRFRGRIMFPINDVSGRIIAFSGRIFDKPKTGRVESEPAKYINTPETALFSKSKVLYGYDKAKEGIRKWGFTILVEGQMDLLMSHQAGFRNTVALSGTALTEEHIALISRLSPKLVLALDSDEAGLRASGKSATLTLSQGMDVKVASLKEGKDPADLIKVDPELWKKAIRESSHIIDFYLKVIEGLGYEERKFRQEVSRKVLPYVAAIESPIDRAHFVAKVAAKLRLPEQAILEEVRSFAKDLKKTNFQEAENAPPIPVPILPEKIESIENRILGLVQAERSLGKGYIRIADVEGKLKEIVGEDRFEKIVEHVRLSQNTLFEGEMLYESAESGEILEKEVEDLLLHLKYHLLKQSFESFMHELKEKEQSGESKEAETLLAKCHELSKEIAKIDLLLKK